MDALAAFAEQALTHDDPWEGFAGLLTWALEQMAADRGLREADRLPLRDGRPRRTGAAAPHRRWLGTCRLMGRRPPDLSPEQRVALLPRFRAQQLKLEELRQQAHLVAAVD
ncbi:hypothetical protein [Streptomyces lydicus]|uniref:hypothetical protein n=1 Tax=Streptomyces lydicus TaxID=47763 RepID=UPI0036FF7C2F